jgi:hypothetical protein
VSYFRPQKAGKIGPRTDHSFSDSTSRLSQNAGQVKTVRVPPRICLTKGVQSAGFTICVQVVYKKAVLKGLKMDLSNAESQANEARHNCNLTAACLKGTTPLLLYETDVWRGRASFR